MLLLFKSLTRGALSVEGWRWWWRSINRLNYPWRSRRWWWRKFSYCLNFRFCRWWWRWWRLLNIFCRLWWRRRWWNLLHFFLYYFRRLWRRGRRLQFCCRHYLRWLWGWRWRHLRFILRNSRSSHEYAHHNCHGNLWSHVNVF
jgi:hypothetical protein